MRSLLRVVGVSAGTIAVLVVCDILGIVGFRYPKIIENEPLRHPVRVKAMDGTQIHLADGRHLIVKDPVGAGALNERIRAAGNLVEVELIGETEYLVSIKKRSWVCGTPYAALLQIPLIPDPVNINTLEHIGVGNIVAAGDPDR